VMNARPAVGRGRPVVPGEDRSALGVGRQLPAKLGTIAL
jgi:hypothetical protein